MNILVAPNSMKNAANAKDLAAAMSEGLKKALPDAQIIELPLADGGDYSMEIILKALGGDIITTPTVDPLGRPINAAYGITLDKTAIIEFPKASGYELLSEKERNPILTSSYGTGLQIKDALKKGCKNILLTLGGSATVDGGAGILQALGIKLLDQKGKPLPQGGGNLIIFDKFDTSNINHNALEAKFKILCDVKNPLLGPLGAAPIFAPQKGASQIETMVLDRCLSNWGHKCEEYSGKKLIELEGAGAAGGVTVGLQTFFNAEITSGVAYILNLLKADKLIEEADVIITAEGALDSQTYNGKAPAVLAMKAKEKGKKTICIAGSTHHRYNNPDNIFDAVFSLQNKPMSLDESIQNTLENIKNTSYEIGRLL